MIPILFDSTETSFTSEGLGRLTGAIVCDVAEERNGSFELKLQYPVNGKLIQSLVPGNYILSTHDDSEDPEPFEIYQVSEPLEGFVTVNAWHISYQLNGIIANPFTAASCSAALAALPGASINSNPFTFWTDKSVNGTYKLDVPRSVRSILGGSEGSILDVYGTGEYKFEKYLVRLYLNRGTNNGVSIRYAKNLVSLDRTRDASNQFNAVAPFWESEDSVVYLDHLVVRTGETAGRAIVLDLSNDFDEQPTTAQLEAAAQSYVDASNNNVVKENIKVDFVQLWQTEEYKAFANLQRVKLCDTVNIIYERLGLNATAKVIKVVYDALKERYSSMELGEPRVSLSQQIAQDVAGDVLKNVVTKSVMQSAIEHATELISGGLGGYIKYNYLADGTPSEMLIMDSPDEATAVNIIRLNQNGIGFSNDGGATYRSAWTIDGQFVADFITTGNLNANLITTGTLDAARIAANSIDISKLTATAQAALMTSSSSKTQYYLSTSSSSATGGSWQDTVPTWTSGKYIWTRTSTTKTFADGTSSTTTSTAIYDSALTTALSTASTASSNASSALTNAATAQSTANGANSREQLIYISKPSGTTSVSGNKTWVTNATGNQNVWTTKRPVYNSSYPVLFVATQRQTVSQTSGTTCTCTTPVIDQTTTVIDGGHITTGTIDASVVNVTNLNASNITSGTINAINITGSAITGSTLLSTSSSGSVGIANGTINLYANSTGSGTPFSTIKHVTDGQQGDSVEWRNTGYTKLVNTGGGQWTADFLQFALDASSPSLKFLIYKDSTGAVIEARNSYRFYVNGAQIYANKRGAGDNAALVIRNGTASTDTCLSLKRTDTDREIEMLIGNGGTNRGLYIRDANYSGWLLYYDDTYSHINKPLALSSALALAYGGTGHGAQSAVTSGVVTRSSGATITKQSFIKFGKIAFLYLFLTYSTSVSSSNNLFVGTIASGYRPSQMGGGGGYYGGGNVQVNAATDGTLTVRVCGGVAIAAANGIGVMIQYNLA